MNFDQYYTAVDYEESPELILDDRKARTIWDAYVEGRGVGDDLLQRVKQHLAERNIRQFVQFHSVKVQQGAIEN